jgi:hypothetical protein
MNQGINGLYSKDVLLKREEDLSYKEEKYISLGELLHRPLYGPWLICLHLSPTIGVLTPYNRRSNIDGIEA